MKIVSTVQRPTAAGLQVAMLSYILLDSYQSPSSIDDSTIAELMQMLANQFVLDLRQPATLNAISSFVSFLPLQAQSMIIS